VSYSVGKLVEREILFGGDSTSRDGDSDHADVLDTDS
jgi:hypothetical protein